MNTIQIPADLISIIKNKHLLLDANVFRDSANKHSFYIDLFNDLKSNNVTLATVDLVKYELLKGSSNLDKYNSRNKTIEDIADVIIPMNSIIYEKVYELIKEFNVDGASISVTDLCLSAMLMQYKSNIFLMTRDTTDFIQRIFELVSIINIPHLKGIFTYGIYRYR